MKNKSLLRLALNLTLIASFLGFSGFASKEVLAENQYEEVNSPSLNCQAMGFLMTDTQKTDLDVAVSKTDNKLTVVASLPGKIAEDEKAFAVFINSRTGVVGSKFLEEEQEDSYSCFYTMPYDCDLADIHIYKQKKSDPDFLIKKENFIGRSKFLMAHDEIFERVSIMAVHPAAYDDNNELVPAAYPLNAFYVRITPNYYSFGAFARGYKDYGEIILPKGQENLLTAEEKIVKVNRHIFDKDDEGESVVNSNYFLDFYIPNGVENFRLRYHYFRGDGEEIICNYYIKLIKE